MPVDQRDAAVRAYLEDVFNGHNLKSLDKYMTGDLVSHWLGDRSLHGIPAWRDAMAGFFDAFPDAAYTLNDLFFSGDKGVWRGLGRPLSARTGKASPPPAARQSGPSSSSAGSRARSWRRTGSNTIGTICSASSARSSSTPRRRGSPRNGARWSHVPSRTASAACRSGRNRYWR